MFAPLPDNGPSRHVDRVSGATLALLGSSPGWETYYNSVTRHGIKPILGNQVNWFLDTTSAGLGTTALTDVLEGEFSYGGVYGPYWPMMRANTSFGSHLDMPPKAEIKVTMQANTAGLAYLTNLRDSSKLYLRIDAQGALIEASHPYQFTIDAAVSISNVSSFSDKDGVYAMEYTFEIVEDATWTHACLITIINALAAL